MLLGLSSFVGVQFGGVVGVCLWNAFLVLDVCRLGPTCTMPLGITRLVARWVQEMTRVFATAGLTCNICVSFVVCDHLLTIVSVVF